MKKLLYVLFICLANNLFAQSVTVTESFDAVTFPPTGWAIKQPTLQNNVWLRRTNGSNGNVVVCQPHSGAALARYSSRATTLGYKQNLISKRVDYTNRGVQAATLDFWIYRDTSNLAFNDSLQVYINTGDSLDSSALLLGTYARHRAISTPDTQAASGWYNYSVTIPASYTSANNYFIFQGISRTVVQNQGSNIFIDDVTYVEYPPFCTGTPNVGTIIAPSLLCDGGDSITLSVTNPITTNALGVTYLWEISPIGATTWTPIGTTPSVGVNITQTSTIQLIANCSYSGLSYNVYKDSISVSADTTPVVTVVAQANVVCTGDTAFMKAKGSANYVWTPIVTNLSVSNDTVSVIPTANTVFTVIGTNASGCSASATQNINVSNGPNTSITVFPNDTICLGDTLYMNSIGGGGGNGNIYLWSTGKVTRRDTVVPIASTSYSVTITNLFGCSRSDTIDITVLSKVKAGFKFIKSGLTYNITDTAKNATNVTYYFSTGDSSLLANPTKTFAAQGNYTITQVAYGFCGNDTVKTIVNATLDKIYGVNKNNFLAYPNPIIDGNLFVENYQGEIYIQNALGNVLLKKVINGKAKLDISNLASGVYIIKIKDGAYKFIKQ